jgi:hypothetical protein
MPTRKNGYDGPKLQGSHTTVLEEGIPILRGLEQEEWLVSVRAGWITPKGNGGKKSLSIGKLDGNVTGDKTLKLILRSNGAVQELFLQVDSAGRIPQAIERIREIAGKRVRGLELRLKDDGVSVE